MTSPSEEQFRQVGFTADAANWPLSAAGQAIIAQHNGVRVDQLPQTFLYASGPGMHAWIEALGVAAEPRHSSGRWKLMSELAV